MTRYNGQGSSLFSYSYKINFNDGSVSTQSTYDFCGMDAVIGYTRCTSNYSSSLNPIINFLLKSESP